MITNDKDSPLDMNNHKDFKCNFPLCPNKYSMPYMNSHDKDRLDVCNCSPIYISSNDMDSLLYMIRHDVDSLLDVNSHDMDSLLDVNRHDTYSNDRIITTMDSHVRYSNNRIITLNSHDRYGDKTITTTMTSVSC